MDLTNKGYLYLKEVNIQNIKSFGLNTKIALNNENGEPSLWNIIIGNNGIGKTTILKAIALLLIYGRSGKKWQRFIDHEDFTRFHTTNNNVEIKANYYLYNKVNPYNFLIDASNEEFICSNKGKEIIDNSLTLFAYGASRTMGKEMISEKQEFPALSLFDDNASLLNAKDWLIRADYISIKEGNQTQFEKVKKIIKSLFRTEIKDIFLETGSRIYNDKVWFKTDFGNVDLAYLSLGYKSMLAWMIDFANGLFIKYPESKNPLAEPAICLVDEIDLHIHPTLQREMINFLSKTFPKTQFVVTALSPLILQSAPDANIVLLKKNKNSVQVFTESKSVNNWRLDQIFTSDLFGLESAHSPEIDELYKERRKLLLKEMLDESEENKLKEIESKLDEIPIVESKEALRAIEIIKKASRNI